MYAKSKILSLIFIFASLINAQTAEKKPTEDADKLRKEAVAFLRETLGDVNGMRSLENRISFTSELAGLMWFHDEREARAIYVGAIADFKDLLAKYDSQMNALGAAEGEDPRMGGFLSFGVEPTDRSRLLRRFSIAMAVRQQMATSIAEHDPDLAFGFYFDSISIVSNAELLTQHESRDNYFESQLLTELAEKNAGTATKYAIRSLENGVNPQHVELLKKIYAKDVDKGVDFASAILSRLKTEKDNEMALYAISSLVRFGEETIEESRKAGGKRAIYTTSQLRELAEFMAQKMLSSTDEGMGFAYMHILDKYQPGRAAQVRAKFKSAPGRGEGEPDYATAMNAANAAANSMSGYSNSNGRSFSNSSSNSNSDSLERELQARADAEKKLFEEVQSIGAKKLPKEERDRIVTQARKIIMQTTGRDKKIVSLSMLAAQVAKAGDKELATEIMRDAEKLVNPAPKHYQDFMYSWLLASGYAQADPDKAFPILEETIGRANETLAAFVKVGEFIDVAEEMIVDGEAQVGAFGGQMVRGLTKDLGIADMTIEILSKADFAKTKNLTNRFDRPEVRVLAKMMVLRAVLSPKAAAKQPENSDAVVDLSEPR